MGHRAKGALVREARKRRGEQGEERRAGGLWTWKEGLSGAVALVCGVAVCREVLRDLPAVCLALDSRRPVDLRGLQSFERVKEF